MDVTTKDDEPTLTYLFHRWESDVQVADGGLGEAFYCPAILQEGEATAGLLTGISDLKR